MPSARASRSRRSATASTACATTTPSSTSTSCAPFIATYNLKGDYYNTLLQQIAAVSPAQIRALIRTELSPSNEVIVALGDKAHLDKAFAGAGIKDVKIVEPEYK
jgi:predicted Zn-dependent peptidase